MPECVVGGQVEPGLAPLCQYRLGHGARRCIGGVGILHRRRRALLIGDRLRARPVQHDNLLPRPGDVHHRQRGGGCGDIQQCRDALGIDPFRGDRRGDVRLVLVIRNLQRDRPAQHGPAKIRDRHLRGRLTARAGHVGIHTAHVQNRTQLDRIGRAFGLGNACAAGKQHRGKNRTVAFH